MIPKEVDLWKHYDATTGTVSYQVPPDEAQILYVGDQTLTVSVTGPDGKTQRQEIPDLRGDPDARCPGSG